MRPRPERPLNFTISGRVVRAPYPILQSRKPLVATYFGGLCNNLPHALSLPVSALHLDLVRQASPATSHLQLVVVFCSLESARRDVIRKQTAHLFSSDVVTWIITFEDLPNALH